MRKGSSSIYFNSLLLSIFILLLVIFNLISRKPNQVYAWGTISNCGYTPTNPEPCSFTCGSAQQSCTNLNQYTVNKMEVNEFGCCEYNGFQCDNQCGGGHPCACTSNPTNTPTTRPTRTPTPRPTRTPTPTTTRTPTPTSTVTPSPTPSETPTPTPTTVIDPIACECNGMEYTGTFSPGAEVVFTAKAKVDTTLHPEAKVESLTFHVERWDGTTRTEIAVSVPVLARGPLHRLNTDGTPYDEYLADWTYRIPEIDTGEIEYTVKVESACGSITAYMNKTESVVLSTETVRKLTFIEKISGFFRTLISVLKNSSPIAHLLPQKNETNILGITPGPTVPMTLKFHAFNPAEILPGSCSEQKFRIRYE